ncbi:MAG TPA: 16S rRNA (cytosine(967)-C(5))-methyltransferase RsmB [Firmicutes bacterium]|nr:16S rRNA (cytosine(967)-C(5))-methyltransferase RsmB [Bacillota bacterium]
MTISPRMVAAETLLAIWNGQQYNNVALKRMLRQNGAMSRQDRAFVTETVNGVLRNLYFLDYCIDLAASLPVKKQKPLIQAVLRMGAYQILFLDVPAFAAVNESVKITKARGLGSLSGFVNAVLRKVAQNGRDVPLPDRQKDAAAYLSIRYSHPVWMLRMWLSQYDVDQVEALCQADNEPAEVTLMTNTLKTTPQELMARLTQEGLLVEAGRYVDRALRVKKSADLTALPAFAEGLCYVQDESSALAALALGAKPGERVMDVCAAPGGKSFFLAGEMKDQGQLESRDLHAHKVLLIEEGAKRLGITLLHAAQQDGRVSLEKEKEAFDRVLLDAPCSGLGLLRKKADIRYRRTGEDIDALLPLQKELFHVAAEKVRPGGVLVYSTCTLCKKENEKQREAFLKAHPEFQPEDLTGVLPASVLGETGRQGYVTLLPHIHRTDGFFIARFRKKGGQ